MKIEVTNIKEVKNRKPSHIISVITLKEIKNLVFPPNFNKNNWLHLDISDVLDSNEPGGPTVSDIEKLFNWVDNQKNLEKLLIHCYAGRSRSPAVATLLISRKYGIDTAIKWLKAYLPDSCPNTEIIKLGDDMLKFNGKLLEKVEKFCFENFKRLYL